MTLDELEELRARLTAAERTLEEINRTRDFLAIAKDDKQRLLRVAPGHISIALKVDEPPVHLTVSDAEVESLLMHVAVWAKRRERRLLSDFRRMS